ncbi:MAG: hypothetical protein AAB968_03765 [Patescibacteria group bacterium]
MSFFSRHTAQKYIVINPRSHSIKTAIFEKPTIGIIPTNIQKIITKLTQASRDSQVFRGLHELITSLLKEKAVKKIVIGIGSNIAETSLQEWKIDSLHLREALTAVRIQEYFQQLFNEHRDENHAFLGYPVSIDINGYAANVNSLKSHDASTIKEITLRTVMLKFSDEAGSAFSDLRKAFSGVSIEFIPLQAVGAQTLVATCGITDGILVDVGGSNTAMMFVHGKILRQLTSFSLGADRFSHRIIKTRGGKFVEAQDLARQYSQGLMSKEEQANLSHIFSEEAAIWKDAFIHALESFYPVAPLPRDIYLYGGGSYIPEVRSALWTSDVLKNFSSFESLNVHIIHAPQIFNNDPLQGLIKGPEDVGLASLMHYSLNHVPLF